MKIDDFVRDSATQITKFMNEKLELKDIEVDLSKGKKVRGAFTLLISKCINGDELKALEFASAVELIHLGSISHDDIIDEHKTRRGSIPLHLLKGSKFAVLAGDTMFTKAFEIGSKSGSKEAIEVSDAMKSLLSGAIKEINMEEFLKDVVAGKAMDKFYYKMIGLKTAGLFKSAGRFGALTCTEKSSIIDTFGDIGFNIGLAYQIADDYTDIVKMGNGEKEPDLGSVVSIIPAIVHYNRQYAKTLPFTVLSGKISIDKVLELISSADMSGKMLDDINELLKSSDNLINDLVVKNEFVDLLREYPKYCVNQILSEVSESI